MKINSLIVRDTLGIPHVSLEPSTPLTLIAGNNGAGKSSLCESIRLALLGDFLRGIRHKKDLGAIVRDGAKKGVIEITGEDFSVIYTLPAGARKFVGKDFDGEAIACCLTPEAYARMAPNDRRAFTLELLDVSLHAEVIAGRLVARGCDAAKVEIVTPIIERRGAQAAADYATEQASEARGAWKYVTGEDYGSKKAEGWLPTVATPPDGTVNGLQLEIDALDAEVAEANQKIGAATATAEAVQELSKKMATAIETSRLHARRTDALNAARKALVDAEAALAAARKKAEGGVAVPHWPCHECGAELQLSPGGAVLVPYAPVDVIADPQAKAALPKLEAAVTLCQTSVTNAERDVRLSDEAAVLKQSLEEQLAAVPSEAAMVDVAGLRARIAERQDARRTLVTHQQRIRDAETARANAEQTRDRAAEAHHNVARWMEIAAALQPDGIPGEILAEGIAPMNERLQGLAATAVGPGGESWALVQLAPDMSVTYGGRAYALCSESERYRADVMLAVAIAQQSGVNFLLLDRVDVLSPPGRIALIKMLHRLSADAVPLQVIAAGTFKEPPKGLPPSWTVRWITRGALDTAATEAEAA